MNRKMKFKIFASLGSIGLIIAVIGNACSDIASNTASINSLSGAGLSVCSKAEEFIAKPTSNTIGINYGSNVLENMASCTGLGLENVSAKTKAENQARMPSFSQYGYVGDINSAMMMGIAAVAIELCDDLAKQESQLLMGTTNVATLPPTHRKIFNSFDFTNNAANDSALSDAVNRMARSCWSRSPTDFELNTIINEVNSMGNVPIQSKAIAVCTAVLASIDGFRR